ncbi:hypothetical protein IFM89_016194 [Coptis chinensis]|uniref:Replication factor A C-terminal domain-containing protein n=1 Tax=Coptis chinensis TaxID=261450 RepID=A0A835IVM9_9MAGN|nr:hypothetical protein IFM89_016194 [Coptis chinensis]
MYARYQLKVHIQDDTESTLITIFGNEAEELLKHPASELARLIETVDGIQTVKAIMDVIIGTSIVFEIKINQYNIQSQGRDGFTANKVFQMDYNLDSHQIQEEIEQVTESSQILNDSFHAQLPDNMKQNNLTLMKEKQILLASSNDIPQPSNKKKRSNKTFKIKAYMKFSTEDSNEPSQTSVIRPPSKRVRRIKENKVDSFRFYWQAFPEAQGTTAAPQSSFPSTLFDRETTKIVRSGSFIVLFMTDQLYSEIRDATTNISHVRDLSSMLTSAVQDPIVSSRKIFNYLSIGC